MLIHSLVFGQFRRALSLALVSLACAVAHAADAAKINFDLPAGEAGKTLKQFALQAKREIMFPSQRVDTVKTNAVSGELTVREGLDRLLADTDLKVFEDEKTGALIVQPRNDPNVPRVAPEKASTPTGKVEEGKLVLDTFEVMGMKVLNMDVKRSRDDAQPYVILDRTTIEQSGATSVEDFLRQRLPQQAQNGSESQITSTIGPRSQINLRGLGLNQTLILIDGRRVSGASFAGSPLQADINGIPLSAIERIEILPTTASGIYGGSATGGVVNVVLRRNYMGVEVKATYDNTFDTDTAIRRIELSSGFTLEGGKTNVLLAASWSDQNLLLTQDRNFIADGMAKLLANSPNYFASSTPLGATTNIRSTTNAVLVFKPAYGGASLGSSRTYIPYGYTGVASDNGAALIANAGKFNYDQPDTEQSRGKRSALLAGPERQSFMATVRRQFTPWLQAFGEFQASRVTNVMPATSATGTYTIPATASTNPFTTPVQVAVPLGGGSMGYTTESRQERFAGGVIVSLPYEWKGTLDYSRDDSYLSSSIPATTSAFADTAAMTAGTLNPFRDVNLFPIDVAQYYGLIVGESKQHTSAYTAAARASGPVWSLPAGAPVVSMLFESRGDIFHRSLYNNGSVIIPRRSQYADSVYAEVKVPLVSAAMHVPLMHELELQLAGRSDRYEINSTNTSGNAADLRSTTRKLSHEDPTIGLRWKATDLLMLRGSYGTGYLPPAVNQLTPNPGTSLPVASTFTDPKRGNELITYTPIFGGSPNLRPELSETYSAGLVFTPEFVKGLRLSVDWTRTKKRDNIATVSDPQIRLNFEDELPADTVIRAAPPAGDPFPVGPVTAINLSPLNFARAEVEAYDLQLDYTRETQSFGRFNFSALATRTMHYKTQLLPTSPIIENVGSGTLGSATNNAISPVYPFKWKGNLTVTWSKGPWTLGWLARYVHEYYQTSATNILAQGDNGRIAAQDYHDLFATYRFGASAGGVGEGWRASVARLLRRTEIQIGVRNIFSTEPPYDAAALNRLYSYQGDPRVSSYYLSVKKAF